MIRSIRGLITAFVLTLILGLIILFPARVAIGWFVPSAISINGIKGSVWNGSAKEAAVNGIYLRDVKWSLHGLRLLTGKLSYSAEATPVAGFFVSDIKVGFDGSLYMSDLTAALPLESFADSFGVPGLEGGANLAFERVDIVDGWTIAAKGTVQLNNLVIPIPGIGRMPIGGYEADFFPQNNGIAASIEDTDGVLDMAGSLEVRKDRSYKFYALASAKPEAPQELREQLLRLPPANDRGQRELSEEGVL